MKSSLYFLMVMTIAFFLCSLSIAQTAPASKALMVGDLKVHKLVDGQIYLNLSLLADIEPSEAKKLNNNKDSAATPVNAYLVQTAHHLVLVDAGIGKYPGENSGHLLEQLKDAGVDPANIDLILITHYHFDHIGGLTSPEGKRLFPNATIRASQEESDFWMRDTSHIPQNLRGRALQIKAVFAPYQETKSYKPFVANADLGDGIRAISANGHTPGHTVYEFASKGQTIWCIGDLIHFGNIQFTHPKAGVVFDNNHSLAINTRLAIFDRAASGHIILAAAHLPDMVRLEKDKESYVAKPVIIK